MTTIHKPVLIESAEQAAALPVGTSVKLAVWHQNGHQDYYAGVKVGFNAWFTTSPTADRQDALSRHMVGWTALVPIEAEEEWAAEFESGEMYVNLDEDSARNADGGTAMSRLVTPWEEA